MQQSPPRQQSSADVPLSSIMSLPAPALLCCSCTAAALTSHLVAGIPHAEISAASREMPLYQLIFYLPHTDLRNCNEKTFPSTFLSMFYIKLCHSHYSCVCASVSRLSGLFPCSPELWAALLLFELRASLLLDAALLTSKSFLSLWSQSCFCGNCQEAVHFCLFVWAYPCPWVCPSLLVHVSVHDLQHVYMHCISV